MNLKQKIDVGRLGAACALGICLLAVTGCQTRYDLTLNNGTVITAKSKPQLQNNKYHFIDALDRSAEIHAFRVTSIERRTGGSRNSNPFDKITQPVAKPAKPAKSR